MDGVIESGETSVDESMLTGESLPVSRGPGEQVHGDDQWQWQPIVVARGVGQGTLLQQIAGQVAQTQRSRADSAPGRSRFGGVRAGGGGCGSGDSSGWLALGSAPLGARLG